MTRVVTNNTLKNDLERFLNLSDEERVLFFNNVTTVNTKKVVKKPKQRFSKIANRFYNNLVAKTPDMIERNKKKYKGTSGIGSNACLT